MKLGEVIKFRKDLYFEGAVQADWFYSPEKSALVAENFVFHGSKYFNSDNQSINNKAKIDTISLAEELLNKVNGNDNLNPLTLAIADYGTGKSHLSVALSHLFSGSNYMPETYNKIIKNISIIDKESGNKIAELSNDRNFVIVLNGMRNFNLHSELLKATQKSLNLYGLSDQILKSINKAAEVAEIFLKKNKDRVLSELEEAASKKDWNEKGENLISKIESNLYTDDTAFDIVNEVYESLNGIKIRWDEGIQATNIIETLTNELCGFNGQFDHIVILFDEFGRYLEYASSTDEGRSGESALQEIFESIQNSNGLVHIINFIQSDIKSYLQRVDQSKNISRYINRYDNSDKYYISSNLETVFANLIERSDKDKFDEIVVKEINENESKWNELYNRLNSWTITKGVWKNYDTFKNIIVEGIYPLHPLSTFVLTQLSDYLQNRSSLTLISEYINNYSDVELDSNFRIYPEMLMESDLFDELISAEQEGKQSSQQCIAYSNVLRKYNGKLEEGSLKLLRSNLVVRLLKLKTTSRSDAIDAISYCSNMTPEEVKNELKIIEDEYGILEFDSHANCFDFMEDGTGAYDYKIFKNKLVSKTVYNLSELDDVLVKELAGVNDYQNTNISSDYYITTAEWQFKQELMSIDNYQSAIYNAYVAEWREATKSIIPKGRLVWLYSNKDTDPKYFDKIYKIADKVDGRAPIVFMSLNDIDNSLYNLLREYKALTLMDDRDKKKYDRFYQENIEQVEENIKIEFSELKKKRSIFTSTGIKQSDTRLPIYLTEVFENIYKKIIPFMFDGFVKNNKITPKAGGQFCTIVKLLLSNQINYDSIHNLPQEMRSKIDSLFMETSRTSWGCITEGYKLREPQTARVKEVYSAIVSNLKKSREIELDAIFNTYVKPPYGYSEDIITMLIAVVIANMNFCLRLEYQDEVLTIDKWTDLVVVKDKKINYEVIKDSKIIMIDVNQVTEEFMRVFDDINNNKSISEIDNLRSELARLAKENPVPDELRGQYTLATTILSNGESVKINWNNALLPAKEAIAITMLPDQNIGEVFYNQVRGLYKLSIIDFDEVFLEPYKYGQVEKSEYESLAKQLSNNIYLYVDDYIPTMKVKKTAEINTFKNHVTNKLIKRLEEVQLFDVKQKIEDKMNQVLEKVQDIKDRENIVAIYNEYMDSTKNYSSFIYTEVDNNLTRGKEVKALVVKFKDAFYEDYDDVEYKLNLRLSQLTSIKKQVQEDMSEVWSFTEELEKYEDLKELLIKIEIIIKYGIKKSDIEDYLDLQKFTNELIDNLDKYLMDCESIAELDTNYNELKYYYENYEDNNEDLDLVFDPGQVIEGTYSDLKEHFNYLEKEWISKNLNIDDYSNDQLRIWKERIVDLPSFLSDETKVKVKDMLLMVDNKLSILRVDNAVYYYEQLTEEEKEKFKKMIS